MKERLDVLAWNVWFWWKYERARKFWTWLAFKLPPPLVYWCGIRLWAHATSGKYSTMHVDKMTCSHSLKVWDNDTMGGNA